MAKERYNFRNATDKELAAALNSPNQDKNDAALKEQMRRFDAGEVPTTANTMDKLATQDPGKTKFKKGGVVKKKSIDGIAKRGKTKLKRVKG